MTNNEITENVILISSNLSLSFGGIQALTEVSFEVWQGEILGLIGPNGAGKTCALNCITGFYRPRRGEIYFADRQIARMRPDKVAKLGIARTFQHVELFGQLCVLDNLLMARHTYTKCGPLGAALYVRWAQRDEVNSRRAVDQVISLLGLGTVRNDVVRSLPYGIQKKVGLARALVLQPKLLLLDEPMAGMTAKEKEDMMVLIKNINRLGITIVLIEHDMDVVMGLADRLIVLNFGQKISEGSPERVVHDPRVIEAYLGEEETADF